MALLYLLVGLGASVVGAVSGIGGGVIIKPVLDSVSPFSIASISFLSGCTVLSMAAVSLLRSRLAGIQLPKKRSRLLALGGVTGGLLGKFIFDLLTAKTAASSAVTADAAGFLSDSSVGAVQSIILAVLTVGVLVFTIRKQHIHMRNFTGAAPALLIGLVLGSIASFLGIGGGPINLAVLIYFFSMRSKEAALNSIYIIFYSQLTSLIFTFARGTVPSFDPLILGLMIAGGISGGFIGSHLSRKMTHKEVDRLFSVVLAVITLISLYNFIRFL